VYLAACKRQVCLKTRASPVRIRVYCSEWTIVQSKPGHAGMGATADDSDPHVDANPECIICLQEPGNAGTFGRDLVLPQYGTSGDSTSNSSANCTSSACRNTCRSGGNITSSPTTSPVTAPSAADEWACKEAASREEKTRTAVFTILVHCNLGLHRSLPRYNRNLITIACANGLPVRIVSASVPSVCMLRSATDGV